MHVLFLPAWGMLCDRARCAVLDYVRSLKRGFSRLARFGARTKRLCFTTARPFSGADLASPTDADARKYVPSSVIYAVFVHVLKICSPGLVPMGCALVPGWSRVGPGLVPVYYRRSRKLLRYVC